ncbi:membrane protein [Pectobacterium phage My1]|uniref:Uncharacterized protein n=1 Tax=Pectobacterium phage My1 TaxID=1204539 RepID=J9QM87_9CAUD|nr:membrane protein [Pectobacterium phage My1]AFQ22288.1 hypothetical protein My1_129 [Pectobacterium phage My1]
MAYGVQITPSTGKPYTFTEDTMFVYLAAAGQTNSIGQHYNTGYVPPPGYDIVVIVPTSLSHTPDTPSSYITHYINNAGQVVLHIIPDYIRNTYILRGTYWYILLVPKLDVKTSSYGISILGGNRYTELSDGTKVTTCVYYGDVTVYTGWHPRNVLPSFNDSTHLCFYYYEGDYAMIGTDNGSLRFMDWNGYYNHGRSWPAKVVILSRTTLRATSSGINIWAKNGDVVFNSSDMQVGTGKIITNPSDTFTFSIPGINRPMFLPERCAKNGPVEYWRASKGNQLTANGVNWGYASPFMTLDFAQSIFIDADNYFNF